MGAMAERLFALDPNIRYVAVNRDGRIEEMVQNPKWPTFNPADTDRMEELLVNPTVLDLARRRGDLDLRGIRFIVIRYGVQYQVLFPLPGGHLSVGVQAGAEVIATAAKIANDLGLPVD